MGLESAPDHALLAIEARVMGGAKLNFFSTDIFATEDGVILEFRVARKGPNGWAYVPGEPQEEIMLLVSHDLALAIASDIYVTVPPTVFPEEKRT